MMKKVLFGFLAFFLIGGTAYAAGSSNLVSVLVNGKPVQSGQIINNSTMLPLRAVAEALGAKVDWDNTKKQASITMTQTAAQEHQTGLTLEQLNKIGESVGLVYAKDAAGQLIGTGSGFIVNDVFVTNWHVAEKSASLEIWFANKSETVNVTDAAFKDTDADLIGFPMMGYPSVKLSAEKPEKGVRVYALGYPHRKFQISEGALLFFSVTDEITHSAATDNGSSGGILINSSGEVIGITDAGMDGTEYNNAIPAKVLQDELNEQ